jgi:hypothetical protein
MMKARLIGIWCVALAIVLATMFSASAQFSQRTVTVSGEGESKDEATSHALRAAVEQGVGVLVNSETLVQNSQLISDKIYSQVTGYVSHYDVVEDNGGANGLWEVKVQATVSLAELRKDLQALQLLIDEKDNPRIAIVIREYLDGGELPAPVVQTAFEKFFLKAKFDVVDVAQLEKVKERDATLSYDDPIEAAALGRQFGADVLILGEASAELGSESTAHGVKVYSYSAHITVKAIKTDTAKVIAVADDSASARGGGTKGEGEIGREALTAAGNKVVEKLMDGILEVWRDEVYNVETVQVVLLNADAAEQEQFVEGLSKIEGVQKTIERMVEETTAMYDVLVAGAAKDSLADKITAIEGLKLAIRGKTANRIKVVVEDQ